MVELLEYSFRSNTVNERNRSCCLRGANVESLEGLLSGSAADVAQMVQLFNKHVREATCE